jgi:Putative zinc-finger
MKHPMECEKIRDRFSSLYEGELDPSEEKYLREHLASCSGCQKEFERFSKTMHWLHETEQVEVPDGLLAGIHQKLEDRAREEVRSEKIEREGFLYSVSRRLSVRAVAVVAVVIFVAFLTKSMWLERSRPKEVLEEKAPVSERFQIAQEKAPGQKGEEKKEMKPSAPMSSPKEARQREPIPPEISEGGTETARRDRGAEDLREPIPSAPAPSTKGVERAKPSSEEAGKLESKTPPRGMASDESKPPLPTEKKMETAMPSKQKVLLPEKPSQELILKTGDQEKALSQVQGLVGQFKGEVAQAEGNSLVATLPAASFPEFQKALARLGSVAGTDKTELSNKQKDGVALSQQVGVRATGERAVGSARSPAAVQDRVTIRIMILPE